MKSNSGKLKGFFLGLMLSVVILASAVGGALADRMFNIKPLDYLSQRSSSQNSFRVNDNFDNRTLVNEESVVIDVVQKTSKSVVTVSIKTQERRVLEFDPFSGFRSRIEGGTQQDIGSGFVVSEDGLIVTNKHVVSDTNASYKVITNDQKEYDVKSINRDPSNDLAVLKIDVPQGELESIDLGDSSNLKVGQFVIAIGTALGEFRHTVTTGVISGLGRGIEAGNPFEGYVEKLDDVIQTDAAINSGNSGGPLLNSMGQVIGINVAVAQGAQNVGFALPVNILKDALTVFNDTGSFASKPFLGIEYQMISKEAAILNDLPQGAYIINVISGSPAESAGIAEEDIIISIDGNKVIDNEEGLAGVISQMKAGQTVEVEVWRNGENLKIKATLSKTEE